jgi:hypothetical protein
MTTPTTYTGTLNAFITDSWVTLDYISKSKNPVACLAYTFTNMETSDWVKVGTAEITVTLLAETEILKTMVESIDKEIKATYAHAESKINLLKEKKMNLLSITMETK